MRIAVISPHFPPMLGGVSDHTEKLCRELVNKKNSVTLFSDCPNPLKIESISYFKLTNLIHQLPQSKPDLIIFQFTPLMYAPTKYGITYKLIADLIKIKQQAQIFGIIHESHYPLQFNFKGILIGLPHIIQFSVLAHLTKKCFFSNLAVCQKWQRLLFWRKKNFLTLPVFSNIIPAQNEAPPEHKKIKLLFFGGAHPTNLHHLVLNAYHEIKRHYPTQTELTVIGVTPDQMKTRDNNQIKFLQNIPENDVSLHLKNATLVLAPFSDGVTTRRGTVMAALAHHCALLTTAGPLTRNDVPWREICYLSKNDSRTFCHHALELIENKNLRNQLAQNGHQYYQEHFSVEKTVTKLMSYFGP